MEEEFDILKELYAEHLNEYEKVFHMKLDLEERVRMLERLEGD